MRFTGDFAVGGDIIRGDAHRNEAILSLLIGEDDGGKASGGCPAYPMDIDSTSVRWAMKLEVDQHINAHKAKQSKGVPIPNSI